MVLDSHWKRITYSIVEIISFFNETLSFNHLSRVTEKKVVRRMF